MPLDIQTVSFADSTFEDFSLRNSLGYLLTRFLGVNQLKGEQIQLIITDFQTRVNRSSESI